MIGAGTPLPDAVADSLVAVLAFMGAGFITVYVLRHMLGAGA